MMNCKEENWLISKVYYSFQQYIIYDIQDIYSKFLFQTTRIGVKFAWGALEIWSHIKRTW